ncbi:MAG: hypothetical protein WC119_03245 [Synergistaceae bacterium]
MINESDSQIITEIEVMKKLLSTAICPNCDGSGAIPVQVSCREYVSHEMAMDAGCPEMEGSLYSDDEWQQVECEWCATKRQILEN